MRRNMIQRAASRERNTRIESIRLDKCSGPILDHLTNLGHGHPRLDVLARILTDLTVDL